MGICRSSTRGRVPHGDELGNLSVRPKQVELGCPHGVAELAL